MLFFYLYKVRKLPQSAQWCMPMYEFSINIEHTNPIQFNQIGMKQNYEHSCNNMETYKFVSISFVPGLLPPKVFCFCEHSMMIDAHQIIHI